MSLYDPRQITQGGNAYLGRRWRLLMEWKQRYGKDAEPPEIALTRAAVERTTVEDQIGRYPVGHK